MPGGPAFLNPIVFVVTFNLLGLFLGLFIGMAVKQAFKKLKSIKLKRFSAILIFGIVTVLVAINVYQSIIFEYFPLVQLLRLSIVNGLLIGFFIGLVKFENIWRC